MTVDTVVKVFESEKCGSYVTMKVAGECNSDGNGDGKDGYVAFSDDCAKNNENEEVTLAELSAKEGDGNVADGDAEIDRLENEVKVEGRESKFENGVNEDEEKGKIKFGRGVVEVNDGSDSNVKCEVEVSTRVSEVSEVEEDSDSTNVVDKVMVVDLGFLISNDVYSNVEIEKLENGVKIDNGESKFENGLNEEVKNKEIKSESGIVEVENDGDVEGKFNESSALQSSVDEVSESSDPFPVVDEAKEGSDQESNVVEANESSDPKPVVGEVEENDGSDSNVESEVNVRTGVSETREGSDPESDVDETKQGSDLKHVVNEFNDNVSADGNGCRCLDVNDFKKDSVSDGSTSNVDADKVKESSDPESAVDEVVEGSVLKLASDKVKGSSIPEPDAYEVKDGSVPVVDEFKESSYPKPVVDEVMEVDLSFETTGNGDVSFNDIGSHSSVGDDNCKESIADVQGSAEVEAEDITVVNSVPDALNSSEGIVQIDTANVEEPEGVLETGQPILPPLENEVESQGSEPELSGDQAGKPEAIEKNGDCGIKVPGSCSKSPETGVSDRSLENALTEAQPSDGDVKASLSLSAEDKRLPLVDAGFVEQSSARQQQNLPPVDGKNENPDATVKVVDQNVTRLGTKTVKCGIDSATKSCNVSDGSLMPKIMFGSFECNPPFSLNYVRGGDLNKSKSTAVGTSRSKPRTYSANSLTMSYSQANGGHFARLNHDTAFSQVARPVSSSSSSSIGGSETDFSNAQNVNPELGSKPYWLVKVPRADERKYREQLREIEMELAERTNTRIALQAEFNEHQGHYRELKYNLEGAIMKAKAAQESLIAKWREFDSAKSSTNPSEHEATVEVEQATVQRNQTEEKLKVLKKESDALRDEFSKADQEVRATRKKLDSESVLLTDLRQEIGSANYACQEAYAHAETLRNQLNEKNAPFYQAKHDLKVAYSYGMAGNMDALERHCANRVEEFMESWNKNDEFRKEYVQSNMKRMFWKFGTLNGTQLGINEVPPFFRGTPDNRGRTSTIVVPPAPVLTAVKDQSAKAKDTEVKSSQKLEKQKVPLTAVKNSAVSESSSAKASVRIEIADDQEAKLTQKEEFSSKEIKETGNFPVEATNTEGKSSKKAKRRKAKKESVSKSSLAEVPAGVEIEDDKKEAKLTKEEEEEFSSKEIIETGDLPVETRDAEDKKEAKLTKEEEEFSSKEIKETEDLPVETKDAEDKPSKKAKRRKAKKETVSENSLAKAPVVIEIEEEKEEPKLTEEEEEIAKEGEKLRREEEELAAKKAEQLRREEEAARLMEQRKLEAQTKAVEALERKRRNAMKAQARAELKAQKEAEEKEKEREKREKKKQIKRDPNADVAENITAQHSEPSSESVREIEVAESSAVATKRTQKAYLHTKKIKTITPMPAALRNKGKRGLLDYWPHVCIVLLAIGWFYLIVL